MNVKMYRLVWGGKKKGGLNETIKRGLKLIKLIVRPVGRERGDDKKKKEKFLNLFLYKLKMTRKIN